MCCCKAAADECYTTITSCKRPPHALRCLPESRRGKASDGSHVAGLVYTLVGDKPHAVLVLDPFVVYATVALLAATSSEIEVGAVLGKCVGRELHLGCIELICRRCWPIVVKKQRCCSAAPSASSRTEGIS